MFTRGGKSTGPGAPKKVPAPGMTSAVGPAAPAMPSPVRKKNTRDYGKAAPMAPQGPPPSPFGPDDGGI